MPATVQIHRITGAPGDAIDITSVSTRANAEDRHSQSGTANAVKIPDSGYNYSFWVSTRLYVATGLTGIIDNIKWYTDGVNSLGTGVTCIGNDATTYKQATGIIGTSGIELNVTNHNYLTGAPVSAFTFTSASPKSVPGSISVSAGYVGNLMIYQIKVDSTASVGTTGVETFTWQYDET